MCVSEFAEFTRSSAISGKALNACACRHENLLDNTTKHNFPCCTIKSCPLANDCNLMVGFSKFYQPLSSLMPSMRGIPLSYRVHIWYRKTRTAGLQSGESCTMIDSVVLGTIHQCDRHTHSHVATASVAPTHCIWWQKHHLTLTYIGQFRRRFL